MRNVFVGKCYAFSIKGCLNAIKNKFIRQATLNIIVIYFNCWGYWM